MVKITFQSGELKKTMNISFSYTVLFKEEAIRIERCTAPPPPPPVPSLLVLLLGVLVSSNITLNPLPRP